MATVLCPHCGSPITTETIFCPHCGVELQPSERVEESTTASVPPIAEDSSSTSPASPANRREGQRLPTEETGPAQEQSVVRATPERLLIGVQGLLEPVRLSGNWAETQTLSTELDSPWQMDEGEVQLINNRLTSELPLVRALPLAAATPISYRYPLLIIALLLAAGVPYFLQIPWPAEVVQRWSGVEKNFDALQGVEPGDTVLVLWAYDPSTAAELDTVALPVIRHLVARQAYPVVFSLMAGGSASARRLFAKAQPSQPAANDRTPIAGDRTLTDIGFLPGGILALPLIGQNWRAELQRLVGANVDTVPPPRLAIVVAAQAEDVQQFLEIAQPLLKVPTIAVTSAVADPMLRPYLDSEQLVGLVSGFDGATTYQQLTQIFIPLEESEANRWWLAAMGWGHVLLLLVLLLGNLVATTERE